MLFDDLDSDQIKELSGFVVSQGRTVTFTPPKRGSHPALIRVHQGHRVESEITLRPSEITELRYRHGRGQRSHGDITWRVDGNRMLHIRRGEKAVMITLAEFKRIHEACAKLAQL